MIKIAICAPGKRLEREHADAVQDRFAGRDDVELVFHRQCFERHGHFAGDDATRLAALLECANDDSVDAVWFAAGGYGSNRIAADALAGMGDAARGKTWLGYSDTGYLLAALYRTRTGVPVHGPMVADIGRPNGEHAIDRAVGFLCGDTAGVEAEIDDRATAAFNLTTLAMLCGTDLMPDLSGHVVLIEEVSEHLYAIDRLLFHVSHHLRGIAGLRLGRISDIPENDRPFGQSEEEIVRYWCAREDIPYLGFADIGHDAANKIVPFGLAAAASRA
uniref:LD-carboxypeptidase n=1 Tax=Parerythrobacter lutipelagi TaxID=1964208 RepID=UPI0010F51F03|nr:LD-carboxypeptidase [Parerythrobacter lutipelagi]